MCEYICGATFILLFIVSRISPSHFFMTGSMISRIPPQIAGLSLGVGGMSSILYELGAKTLGDTAVAISSILFCAVTIRCIIVDRAVLVEELESPRILSSYGNLQQVFCLLSARLLPSTIAIPCLYIGATIQLVLMLYFLKRVSVRRLFYF